MGSFGKTWKMGLWTGREACPTLSYSTGVGWGLKPNSGKWGEGKGLFC